MGNLDLWRNDGQKGGYVWHYVQTVQGQIGNSEPHSILAQNKRSFIRLIFVCAKHIPKFLTFCKKTLFYKSQFLIGRPARPSHNPTVSKRSDIKLRLKPFLSSLILFPYHHFCYFFSFFTLSLPLSLLFENLHILFFRVFFYWDRET